MRRLTVLAHLALLALAGCASSPQGRATLAPFHSDGCSLFPDGTPARPDLWCDCCLRHDLAYWQGGTEDDRLAADRALRACVVTRTGDPALGGLVYAGVRAGGPAVFPTGFRWGYGWPYGHGARAPAPAEQEQVDALLKAYLARNPTLRCAADRAPAPSTRPVRPPVAPAPRLAHGIGLGWPAVATSRTY